MNPSPLVSVIIPAYNQAQFLPGAITSVLTQTYQNFEIIVVDDGSVDNTKEIAGEYIDVITYIRQDNRGLAGARNTGIRAAKGEYIGLLDSDDEWLPNFLESMVGLSHHHREAVAFYCLARCVNETGEDLPQILGGSPSPSEELYCKLVKANFIIPSTTLIHRDAVINVGLFDESLRSCEDWDLWLRLLPNHTIEGTDEVLVKYRIHSSSLSTDPFGMQRAAQAVIEKHFGQDDGRPSEWSDLKKRAYGGLYSYHAWTSVLRNGDWAAGGEYLLKALLADVELISNLDVYYEILLGRQPLGYRGTNQLLNIVNNVAHLEKVLRKLSSSNEYEIDGFTLKKMNGALYYSAGLLAYNTRFQALSRKYLYYALKNRSDLWRDFRFINTFVRSFLPTLVVLYLKNIKSILSRKAK